MAFFLPMLENREEQSSAKKFLFRKEEEKDRTFHFITAISCFSLILSCTARGKKTTCSSFLVKNTVWNGTPSKQGNLENTSIGHYEKIKTKTLWRGWLPRQQVVLNSISTFNGVEQRNLHLEGHTSVLGELTLKVIQQENSKALIKYYFLKEGCFFRGEGCMQLITIVEMADARRILSKATSWLGLFCGMFTVIVWCFLLKALSPQIKVDKDDPLNDINKGFWRTAMFTFAPSVFFDIWTPFVMGFISILCHFQQHSPKWMCRTYLHYFVWNFALALFGNIGYSGGVGVICSAFSFLCALMSLICIFVARDQTPSLELQLPEKLRNKL